MARVEIRVRSFIPMAYAYRPGFLPQNVRFLGDNRNNADWNSTKYRTSQSWIVNTDGNIPFIESSGKKIGETVRQEKKNGKWVTTSRKTASTNGLTYTTVYTQHDGAMYISCKCESANPLQTASLDIDYEFNIKVSKGGSVRVIGTHDGAPAYEILRRNYTRGTSPETIYFFNPPNMDFKKLSPGFSQRIDVRKPAI